MRTKGQQRTYVLGVIGISLAMLVLQTGIGHAAVSFVDVAKKAGIGNAGTTGVAWIDYDNDGDEDIYTTNVFGPNVLYRNNGDGTFTDVSKQAKVEGTRSGNGIAIGDYNNDGYLDIYVANSAPAAAPNLLYRNNGDGTFSEIAKRAGVDAALGQGSGGCAFGDYDADGDLDIFATSSGGLTNLYRNDGNDNFTDVTQDAGINIGGAVGGCFFDFNSDGWLDIFVQGNASFLYRNLGKGKFEDVTQKSKIRPPDGHGPAIVDYDNDGDLDIYIPRRGADVFYRNNGDGTFTDVTRESGLGDPGHSMGHVFFDYDNDGDLDLFSANSSLGGFQPRVRFYENKGDGTFAEASKKVGLDLNKDAVGAAGADYDGDGDVDIYLTSAGNNSLFRNEVGNANNWLRVKVIGKQSNRSGIGAVVRVKTGNVTQMRVIGLAHTYSQSELTAHFGLERDSQADLVEVYWPTTGRVDRYTNVAANQLLMVTEGLPVEPRGKLVTTFGKIKTQLYQNYPNPFNPETWIPFALSDDTEVTIAIYDTIGNLVRRFDLGRLRAGIYTSRDRAFYWNGRNTVGEHVSSGVYFYQLRVGEFSATRKLVIAK